jgi:hypothetical protein
VRVATGDSPGSSPGGSSGGHGSGGSGGGGSGGGFRGWYDTITVPPTSKLLLCGGVAGAFSKTCTAPLARLTILRQLQSTGAVPGWVPGQNHGMLKALAKITREEGVRALWKGNGVTVLHRLPYSSINFYAYENIMDWLEGEGAYSTSNSGSGQNGEGGGGGGAGGGSGGRSGNQKGIAWDVTRRLIAGGSAGMTPEPLPLKPILAYTLNPKP